MGSEIAERGLAGKVDGVLLDLGVSSPQLDDPERGFSFMNDGPLDMRMDPDRGISAAEFVNTASQEEIARVFKEYGEERFAGRMARPKFESIQDTAASIEASAHIRSQGLAARAEALAAST